MIQEKVMMKWDNLSIYYPPEMLEPLSKILKVRYSNWQDLSDNDDMTIIETLDGSSRIESNVNSLGALFKGIYGQNLQNIKDLKSVVKGICILTKRDDPKKFFQGEKVESTITYEGVPTNVKLEDKDGKSTFHLHHLTEGQARILNKMSEKIPSGEFSMTLNEVENFYEIGYTSDYNDFVNKYKHFFSEVFQFKLPF